MNRSMIDTLQKSIHERYYLPRHGRDWRLANGVRLQDTSRQSLGFSLDNQESPPLAFFSASPPARIAKMCDAIVVLLHKDTLYFFIIEQKTGNKGDYIEQLANGKFFCQWLVALYNHYDYCDAGSVQYIGMLIWKPGPFPGKEVMGHRKPEVANSPLFDRYHEVVNNPLVMLDTYIPTTN